MKINIVRFIKNDSVNQLMIISILSKAFGLLRDLVLTFYFGANNISDSFIIALTVPGTVCDLLIQAIAVGFIPIYTNVKNQEDRKHADDFTIQFIELLLLACLPVVVLVIAFPQSVIELFASGFDQKTRALASTFVRITIISIFFKMIVSVLTGYLQSNRRFTVAAIVGIPYDIIIIIGIICGYYVETIMLPISVVIASLLQAIIVIVDSKRIGITYGPRINIINENTKKIFKMILPLILIVGVNQINAVVDKTFASYVQIGSITILDYANKICLMIENVVVLSVIAVLYPSLNDAYVKNDEKMFCQSMQNATEKIVVFLLPATVLLALLAEPITDLLLGRGAFSSADVSRTASCMTFYSIGILFVAMRTVYTRALYSIKKIKAVTVISVICLFLNVLLNYIFVNLMGLAGLALATSISNCVSAVLMYFVLRKEIKLFRFVSSKKKIWLVSVISVAIALCIILAKYLLSQFQIKYSNIVILLIFGVIYCITVLEIDKKTINKS